MQGKFKFVTHAPVKRSEEGDFTAYHHRLRILDHELHVQNCRKSSISSISIRTNASCLCQWAPFAARTAADRFWSFHSMPTSVCQAGDLRGSISMGPPPGCFTLCDFQLHVPGSLDVASRLPPGLWIQRFRSSHMSFVISCTHGKIERGAEDQ